MTTDNKDNKLSIGSSDYAEILRHAVAVIEHARTEIARHVNGYVSAAYWEIGQMLHERKIESGYGDSVVRRLSADLKERYPKMGVSPRNLWYMKSSMNVMLDIMRKCNAPLHFCRGHTICCC